MPLFSIAAGDKFVPVTIEENDLFDGITNVLKVLRPTWPLDDVKFKVRRKYGVIETNYMELWAIGVYLFYINFQTFTDGITNKLVACQFGGDASDEDNVVLVRIYGNKTDLLIDRNAEIR